MNYAECPKNLEVEVVEACSSIPTSFLHFLPRAPASVYLLIYPMVCHWNEHCGPFSAVRIVISQEYWKFL